MAKLLALEWDAREARIVLARTRGSELVIEQAMAVDLSPREGEEEVNVGQRIVAALSARGITRAETLVAVGRTNIELRQLSLPNVPVEELPELVRFQSLREFSRIDESWPIDFALLATSGDESIQVLAASISPQLVERIQQTCQSVGLTSKRIVLRPFAAASLMKRHDAARGGGCCLMIDLLAEEVDLTVLLDGEVALIRTVRISAEDEDYRQTPALLGEIRRTMLAGQNQLGGRRIEQIVLCGDEKNHTQLRLKLAEELQLDVAMFNPFEGFSLDAALAARPVEHPGRYAPLLGMLQQEAAGQEHAIDFLNPRKKAEPPNQRRRLALIGAAAAAALLLTMGIVWGFLWSKDAEIVQLQRESFKLDEQVKSANESLAKVAKIKKFCAGDVNLLDELRMLSEAFPPSDRTYVTQLLATTPAEGGRIILDGRAVDYATIDKIETNLRKLPGHHVSGRGGKQDDARETYRLSFKETITIEMPKAVSKKSASPPSRRPSP